MELFNRRAFRLGACATCGGDAYLDLTDTPEWRCLQCARLVAGELAPAPLASAGLKRAA